VELNRLYEAVRELTSNEQERSLALNYLTSDLWGAVTKPEYTGRPLAELEPEHFADIITMLSNDTISSRGAKNVLVEWLHNGEKPKTLVKSMNLEQVSDQNMLESVIDTVLSENTEVAQQYRDGKETALQYLIGQSMKATKGSADPKKLKEILSSKLS
jgi:aspartyl-tRNA(Asn)/glutamyl-tRNA(Gln) amidotransferase subunit B